MERKNKQMDEAATIIMNCFRKTLQLIDLHTEFMYTSDKTYWHHKLHPHLLMIDHHRQYLQSIYSGN